MDGRGASDAYDKSANMSQVMFFFFHVMLDHWRC